MIHIKEALNVWLLVIAILGIILVLTIMGLYLWCEPRKLRGVFSTQPLEYPEHPLVRRERSTPSMIRRSLSELVDRYKFHATSLVQ